MRNQIEATVLGGFPILVNYDYDHGYYEIDSIETMKGKRADFIEKRMDDKEWENLLEYVIDHAGDSYEDY